MFFRKVVSWPNSMHEAARSNEGSQHGSRHGPRLCRLSTSFVPETEFDFSFKPERIANAVFHDDQRVIDAILAAGGKDEVRNAIIWRVFLKTIEKLYARGCSDLDFMHNLYSAASFGRPEMVDTLLDHTGLTVHMLGRTGDYRISLLYAAARAGHTDVVQRLLARGADPSIGRFRPGLLGRRRCHTTALEAAVINGCAPVVRLLINHTPVSPRELLHLLDTALHQESYSCCHTLLAQGVLPNAATQQRITALGDPLLTLALRRALNP